MIKDNYIFLNYKIIDQFVKEKNIRIIEKMPRCGSCISERAHENYFPQVFGYFLRQVL